MLRNFKLIVFLIFIFQCSFAFSQKFEEVFVDTLNRLDVCRWIDYDNDGDLDIIASTREYLPEGYFFDIYVNDNGNFIKDTVTRIPRQTSFNIGDMNNDNSVDVITMGDRVRVYLNPNGSSSGTGMDFGYFSDGEIEVADFTNDGRADLVLNGSDLDGHSTLIRINEHLEYNESEISLRTAEDGFATDGDYDNDGFIDVLSSGWGFQNPHIEVERNYNNEFFLSVYTSLEYSTPFGGWSDFNNDGFLDFYLINYSQNYGPAFRDIYENQHGSTFIKRDDLPPDSSFISSNACGDIDNDGYQDIVTISAITNSYFFPEYPVQLAINQHDFTFQDILDSTFKDISYGRVALGDYDNDGSLDILISGNYTVRLPSGHEITNTILKLFKNITFIQNQRPVLPQFLNNSVTDNNTVNLEWSSGQDNETESPALSYNLYIRSESGYFAVSPMADIVTGFKKTADQGNAYHSLRKVIKNVPAGKYKWSVQSVDNSYYASEFAPPDSFQIIPTARFEIYFEGCTNEDVMVRYVGNALVDSNTTFIWSADGGTIEHYYLNEFVIKWNTGGIKNVSLTVIRDGLSSTTVTHQINLIHTPEPYFEIPKNICMYDTVEVIYTGSAEPGTNFNFRFENGYVTSGIDEGPYNVYWSYAGPKLVSLSADYEGCYSESSRFINILPVPQIDPISHVDIDTSNSINIYWDDDHYEGGVVNSLYRNNSDGSVKLIYQYSSTFNGFVTDTVFSPETKYYSYFKQARSSNGCSSTTNNVEPITLDYVLFGDSRIKLSWESKYDISGQSIYFGRGSKENVTDNEITLYNDESTYIDNYTFGENLYYRIHNEIECYCFDDEAIDVYSNIIKIHIDEDSLKIHPYPNPFHDILYINSNIDFEFAQVNIYDIYGLLVLNSFVNSDNSIDLSNLASGIYFIKFYTNKNDYLTKIVKF